MTEHRENDAWAVVLDESITNDVLSVGGFLARQTDLPRIASAWRELKINTFQVPADTELKYNIPEGPRARKLLDDTGWNRARRVPVMLRAIVAMPVMLVADTVVDMRGQQRPGDYYIDALFWCVRRLANHLDFCLARPPGPHLVIVDYPPAPGDLTRREVSWRVRRAFKHVSTAAFHAYQDRYFEPELYGHREAVPYHDLDFLPTLAASHARHDDLLQIADVVAGCVRDFCAYNVRGVSQSGELPEPAYQYENMQMLAPQFHKRNGRAKGYGFGLWPPRHNAYASLVRLVNSWCADGSTSAAHDLCVRDG